jgi:hypothetical protein
MVSVGLLGLDQLQLDFEHFIQKSDHFAIAQWCCYVLMPYTSSLTYQQAPQEGQRYPFLFLLPSVSGTQRALQGGVTENININVG